MSPSTQSLEILNADDLHPDDLTIIQQATDKAPGVARLHLAHLGKPDPQTPASLPLLSHTGPKFGFVAAVALLEPPYSSTYYMEEVR